MAQTIAALGYHSPWDALIADLKFHRRPGVARLLAQRLHEAVATQPSLGTPLVMPIPLSAERLQERGYNQAWEIARRLASMLSLPADAQTLLRLHDTPHQIGLPRAQRLSNVAKAFAVDPLRRHLLAGRQVAIVDDVMTTGATVEAAARVLLQAGAASVEAWVVARAE